MEELAMQTTKLLFLPYVTRVGPKHGKPAIGSEWGQPQALFGEGGASIIEEGCGGDDLHS